MPKNDKYKVSKPKINMNGNLVDPNKKAEHENMDDSKMHIPYLRYFGSNLNAKVAKHPHTKYAVGRENQMSSIMQILLHENKNTPMLIGEAGVGKTDIVEGFAKRLYENRVPYLLRGYQVWNINLGMMNNDIKTGDAGYFNSNFSHIIDECKKYSDKIILFIDEFHTIMGASKTTSGEGMDGSQLLKPPLARGEIKLIGATTFDEFYDYVEPDRALQRRLNVIKVPQPGLKKTFNILKQNTQLFTEHYRGITVPDKVVNRCVHLADRYITDRFMPDKAFDVLDSTFSEAMVKHHKVCTLGDCSLAIYHMTNVPLSSIAKALSPNIINLKQNLKKRIKGQDQAVDTVVKAIDLFFAGLNDPRKPVSFLFLGTTGVGKTEMAKALAQDLFGNENDMIRLDMASFNTKDASAKLIGKRNKKGILTEAVRRHPYGVLLMDEIEKSNPDIWDLLLSILDDGEIQDSRGRTVSFKNEIIILTSNLATDVIKNRQAWVGSLTTSRATPSEITEHARKHGISYQQAKKALNAKSEEERFHTKIFNHEVERALKRTFRPELVNRLSNKVVFNVLGKEQIIKIAQKYMSARLQRLHRVGYDLDFNFNTIDYLTDLGTDIDNGARPLERTIDQDVMGPIAKDIIKMQSDPSHKYDEYRTFVLGVEGERPHYNPHIFNSDSIHIHNDNWGSRQFTFQIRKAKLTPAQKRARHDIFTPENIKRMVSISTKHRHPSMNNVIAHVKHRLARKENQP